MQYGHCVVKATATAISSLYFTGIAPSATAALSNAQNAFITSGASVSIFFNFLRFSLLYICVGVPGSPFSVCSRVGIILVAAELIGSPWRTARERPHPLGIASRLCLRDTRRGNGRLSSPSSAGLAEGKILRRNSGKHSSGPFRRTRDRTCIQRSKSSLPLTLAEAPCCNFRR